MALAPVPHGGPYPLDSNYAYKCYWEWSVGYKLSKCSNRSELVVPASGLPNDHRSIKQDMGIELQGKGFKTIYLIRHGQAECNIDNRTWIADAPLTDTGRSQCITFATSPLGRAIQDSVELVFTSPQRRALSTTLLALPQAVERLLPESRVILVPQLQEINDLPCDRGSDREALESTPEYTTEIKHGRLDFSPLTPDWNQKQVGGMYDPHPDALWARAQWVRRLVRDSKEEKIAIVAHGNFIRYLVGLDGYYGQVRIWSNVEAREYTFESMDDERAKLVPVVDDSRDDS